MKHLKKLAALLLVGVLALSLLTACGGGGGSTSADAQAETAGDGRHQSEPSRQFRQIAKQQRAPQNSQSGPGCCHQWKMGPAQFFFYIQIPY